VTVNGSTEDLYKLTQHGHLGLLVSWIWGQCFPETSVTNYEPTLGSVLKKGRPQLRRGRSLLFGNALWFASNHFVRYVTYFTAVGLPPGGSSTVHIYTQTIHRTIQSTETIYRTTQFTNLKECGPCPVFARYTLAYALQLRKEHDKTSVRVVAECQLARRKQNVLNRAYEQ